MTRGGGGHAVHAQEWSKFLSDGPSGSNAFTSERKTLRQITGVSADEIFSF